MKKRLLFVLIICTFPFWAFLDIWQSYRFERLHNEISSLERQQADLLEQNRKLAADIESLNTPDRIERIAVRDLGLVKPEPSHVTKLVFPWHGGGRNGL